MLKKAFEINLKKKKGGGRVKKLQENGILGQNKIVYCRNHKL